MRKVKSTVKRSKKVDTKSTQKDAAATRSITQAPVEVVPPDCPPDTEELPIQAWVDGGFYYGHAFWGCIVVQGDVVLHQSCGYLKGEINAKRQIGGELKAAMRAVDFFRNNNVAGDICYDYTGIYKWVCAPDEKEWAGKEDYVKKYQNHIRTNRSLIRQFIKVKSHSTSYWNNRVDQLVRSASLCFARSYPELANAYRKKKK